MQTFHNSVKNYLIFHLSSFKTLTTSRLDLNSFLFRSDVIELMSRVKEIISNHEVLTGEAFSKGDIAAAKKIVAKMSYFVNLRDQLVKKEMDLGIVH